MVRWCGVVWCGVVWCGVVWCGVVWCGVVWCGVMWYGVVWYSTHGPSIGVGLFQQKGTLASNISFDFWLPTSVICCRK